jgi:hypothetical protein
LLLGVIATLTAGTLQDDIATVCRKLIGVGREILRRHGTSRGNGSACNPLNPS